MTPCIRTTGLTRRFQATMALDGIDLQVPKGECLGLVGPHGGGRSTLLRILATVIRPSSGTVEIDGIDAVGHVFLVRSRLAYVGEESVPGFGLRAGEHLEFVRRARQSSGQPRALVSTADALKRAAVSPDAPVDSLSPGLRQRLNLATALSVGAEVLLLDGPLQDVDRSMRTGLLEWLREALDRGMTMVVAATDDPDLEALCHRTVQLDAGRLVPQSHAHEAATAAAPHAAAAAWIV